MSIWFINVVSGHQSTYLKKLGEKNPIAHLGLALMGSPKACLLGKKWPQMYHQVRKKKKLWRSPQQINVKYNILITTMKVIYFKQLPSHHDLDKSSIITTCIATYGNAYMLHGNVGIYLLYPSQINYPSLVRGKTHLYINKHSVSLKKAFT